MSQKKLGSKLDKSDDDEKKDLFIDINLNDSKKREEGKGLLSNLFGKFWSPRTHHSEVATNLINLLNQRNIDFSTNEKSFIDFNMIFDEFDAKNEYPLIFCYAYAERYKKDDYNFPEDIIQLLNVLTIWLQDRKSIRNWSGEEFPFVAFVWYVFYGNTAHCLG